MQKKADFRKIANRLLDYVRLGWIGSFLLIGILDACTSAVTSSEAEERIGDADREDQEIERVISLAPNLTEIIFALGAEKKLVARSQACDFPKGVDTFPVIKTYPSVDWEQIVYYQPDIVWGTDELFSPDVIELLTSRDIPLRLQSYTSVADVYKGIDELGKVLGYKEEARLLIDSIQHTQRLLLEGEQGAGTAMIWISEDPLVVAGGTGYMQDLLAQTGWTNVFEDKKLSYAQSTVEELLFKDPSVIFFPSDREHKVEEVFAKYPTLKRLSAYKLNQVFLLEPDHLYRPGPRLIKALESMLMYARPDHDEKAQ